MSGPARVGVVEPIEKAAQIVRTRPVRTGDQIVDDLSKAMFRELAEVLGKQAPHALQDEVAENVRISRAPILQTLVQVDKVDNRLTRECRLATCKHGVAAGEKEQCVVLVREIDQIEHGTGRIRIRAGLPNLELPKCTNYDITRCWLSLSGVGGSAPIRKRLIAVLRQPFGLGRCLHLDKTHSRPDQVEKAPGLRLLEARDVLPVRPIAPKELVQERLSLAPFATGVDTPARGEGGEPRADLLPSERHD